MITSQSHKFFSNSIPGQQKIHCIFQRFALLLLFNILIFNPAHSKEPFRNKIIWQELPSLPPGAGQVIQPGLASPFAGVSENMLLVAGGCNFPDDKVWEGGQKAYYDDAFALEHSEDGEYIWLKMKRNLDSNSPGGNFLESPGWVQLDWSWAKPSLRSAASSSLYQRVGSVAGCSLAM